MAPPHLEHDYTTDEDEAQFRPLRKLSTKRHSDITGPGRASPVVRPEVVDPADLPRIDAGVEDYAEDEYFFKREAVQRSDSIPRHNRAASSPATAILSPRQEEIEFNRGLGYGFGTAHTTDEKATKQQYEDSAFEAALDEPQVEPHMLNNFVQATVSNLQHGSSATSGSRSAISHAGLGAYSTGSSSFESRKMPEFFSHAVFQTVLHNPTIVHQLHKFAQARMCGENIEFLTRVDKYHKLLDEVSKSVGEIHRDFLSNKAPSQVRLSDQVLSRANKQMKSSLSTAVPMLESVFVNAHIDVERLVYTEIYPKYVRHQLSISAAKALGGERTKFAGLGDCFVLTDPAKADNPILFASDGFVKVTGYSRNEIIPRNCRFLQNQDTDRETVRRLKAAIDVREESVELLLNQKKNGEPFWNLLYTTPLYDANGKLAFFLGGQINCSTTIHSASDVLRILSHSEDGNEEQAQSRTLSPPPVKPARSRGLFSAFRTNSRSTIHQRAPGMEENLINQFGEMPLNSQITRFQNAYSNVRPATLHFYTSLTANTAPSTSSSTTPPGSSPSPPPALSNLSSPSKRNPPSMPKQSAATCSSSSPTTAPARSDSTSSPQ